MKFLKMLSLAALAALVAMTFAGPPSAMAESTALCDSSPEEESEVCGLLGLFSHVHEKSVGKSKMVTPAETIECDVEFSGETRNKWGELELLASPLRIVGNFTYSNCNSGCTVTENGSAELEVLKGGYETAKVTEAILVRADCKFVHCNYFSSGLKGTAKGFFESAAVDGEVILKEQAINKESGFLCSSTLKLTITTEPLFPTFIAK